jgi:hypothetical protein
MLLVEEFDHARSQGYISLVETNENRVLIDEKIHMSYPFPLEHAGKLYIIPESQRSREVALFRFERGGSCRRAATLLRDFAALDSTVFQHAGRWWLFCSCQDDLPDSKLYIFHAPDLFGPWSPHTLNPVKCDIRSSRPGGTPFLHQGRLYRPAQDSSAGYGSALSINLVKVLTPDEFEEETVAHLGPVAPYSDGLHTLSSAGAGALIDGKRMIFAPQLTLRRLRHKMSKLMGRSR